MLSRLKPDSATAIGVITAAGVYLIYNNALPNIADIRSAPAHDRDVETARKHAAWMSVALIGGVFLVSRDLNSYIISGAALVGADLMYKHANGTNPATGKLDNAGNGAADVTDGSSVSVHALPDYADTA